MSVELIRAADPGAAYRAHRAEIDAAVARVLASGWYVLGQEDKAFEAAFAAFLNVPHVIGCGNGTDALVLALRGLGIGPGATVATVSHTAVATVAAIEMVGATPLLIDIEPGFYTLDPVELAMVLDRPPRGLPPIKAVIAVHLYGQAADLDALLPLCRRHGVALIEDCAQAHGARLHGKRLGGFGDVASFSFYPTKNLGALGDGGAVACADPALATRIAALRQYGWHQHYISGEAGMNSRLDEIQATILSVRLAHLPAGTVRRQAIAARYDAALQRAGRIAPPVRRPDAEAVFHQYVIEVENREAVRAHLREAGIATLVHYPMAVHCQPAYQGRVALGPAECEASARAAGRVLSVPIHPELTEDEVGRVVAALGDL